MKKNSTNTTRSSLGTGLTLARRGDFEIVADWSLLLVFLLVVFNLGLGVLPLWHPDWSAALVWGVSVAAAVLFFASILLHELSHVAVARAYGIPVRGITLFLFGGMAHMKGEPPHPKAECLMAGAGPLTSIALGLGASVAGGLLASPTFAELSDDPMAAYARLGVLPTLLLWLGPVNLILGVFNLIPGFPLDGGRVLRAVLWWVWGDLRRATYWASAAGQWVAWLLITAGVLMVFGFHVPLFGSGLQGLWLLLIGWFLNGAARMGYEQFLVGESLEGVPVSRLMISQYEVVEPHLRVADLVAKVMAGDQRCFPVISDGRFAGLVCVEDVRKAPRERWDEASVGEIMTPEAQLVVAAPGEGAQAALEKLAEHDVDQLPVVADGELQGLFRRRDALKWFALWRGTIDPAEQPRPRDGGWRARGREGWEGGGARARS